MSLLQEVIEQYGELSSERAKALTDKTDKRGSVSFGSEWSELLENKNGELTEQEIPVAEAMVAIIQMRQKGIVPEHYTATTDCRHCGLVPIFEGLPATVDGCPWCFNRIKGLPIPNTKPLRTTPNNAI